MNYQPSLMDIIFNKTKPLVPRASLVAKVAFYIGQHYELAREFTTLTRNLETLAVYPDIWLAKLIQLREIAKLMDHILFKLRPEYEVLEAYLEKDWQSDDDDDDDALQELEDMPADFINFSKISETLILLECEPAVVKRLEDDWHDLCDELWAFMKNVEQLINVTALSSIQIVVILRHLVSPWSDIGWHALYHLGNYENIDMELYHPGFLGESIIIIEQLSATTTKN